MEKNSLDKMLENTNARYEMKGSDGNKEIMLFPFGNQLCVSYKLEDFGTEKQMMERVKRDVRNLNEIGMIENFFAIADNLYLCLSHNPRNLCTEMFDFYVYVRCFFENTTVEVNRTLLDMWGISEKEVFARAKKNMRKMDIEYMEVEKAISLMFLGTDLGEDVELPTGTCGMRVLRYKTEKSGCGACVILNNRLLSYVKKECGEFYIIPSSVHEVLIIPKKDIYVGAEKIREMIKYVNDEIVDGYELLSYNPMYYGEDGLKQL